MRQPAVTSIAVDEGVGVAGTAQPVEGEERRCLVDRDGAGRIAERAHGLGDGRGRVLVLLPDRDLVAERNHGLEFLDLEGRRDIDDLALGRQHRAVHALGAAKLQPGEIGHARGDIEIERVDALFAHDRLRRRAMRCRRSSTPIGGTSPRMFFMAASSASAVEPPTPTVITSPFQLSPPEPALYQNVCRRRQHQRRRHQDEGDGARRTASC